MYKVEQLSIAKQFIAMHRRGITERFDRQVVTEEQLLRVYADLANGCYGSVHDYRAWNGAREVEITRDKTAHGRNMTFKF